MCDHYPDFYSSRSQTLKIPQGDVNKPQSVPQRLAKCTQLDWNRRLRHLLSRAKKTCNERVNIYVVALIRVTGGRSISGWLIFTSHALINERRPSIDTPSNGRISSHPPADVANYVPLVKQNDLTEGKKRPVCWCTHWQCTDNDIIIKMYCKSIK